MNVGEIIAEARYLAATEETAYVSDIVVARVATTVYRDIVAMVIAKYKRRYCGSTDVALTDYVYELPAAVVSIAMIEDRTGLDSSTEGPEVFRIDAQARGVSGYLEYWDATKHYIRLRGMQGSGTTLRIYYDLDVEKLDSTTPTQVPRLIPTIHHGAISYGAAVKLQRRPAGEPDADLKQEANDKFWAAVMHMGEPSTIWQRV